MKVTIVTGGAGYLGSVLVPYLKEKTCTRLNKIVVVDSLRYNQPIVGVDYISDSAYPNTWSTFDYWDVDAVINLAALVGEPLCSKYVVEANRTNMYGTKLAAEWCREHGAKLIQASTCSNYGVSEGVADEATPLTPLGIYAETKVASEREAAKAEEYTVFRFGTLYGPSPRMRWDLMIHDWVYCAMRDGSLKVYNPNAWRPFLHVQDACRAVQAALGQRKATRNQTFNAAGMNVTKRELASQISSAVGGTRIESGGGDDRRDYRVASSKFATRADFEFKHCFTTLEEDLREIMRCALVRKTDNAQDFVMPP